MSAHRTKSKSGGNPAKDSEVTLRMPQLDGFAPADDVVDEQFDPERTLVQEDRTLVQEDWDTDTVVLEPIHGLAPK